VPRLGAINLHPSLLPKYGGPIPVHWAVRNGDTEIGITAHWMDEDFDTGPIILQRGGIPLHDDDLADQLFGRIHQAVPSLLAEALKIAEAGQPGTPQDTSAASAASWMEPAFLTVDWSQPARRIHNQVRTFRFATSGTRGPTAVVNGELVEILTTRLAPPGGIEVGCGDGPIWVTDYLAAPHRAPDDRIPWIASPAAAKVDPHA
jgi:methionyl-tRNA formyltransferase